MADILTCDPMLNFLGVLELYRLRALCKETKAVIDDHLQNKRAYRADLTKYRPRHEKCLEFLSGLTSLTLVLPSCRIDVASLLKPTLRCLTLELYCPFRYTRGVLQMDRYVLKRFQDALDAIKTALEAGTIELEEFHIRLADKVLVYEAYDTYHVNDYDDLGPVYDTGTVDLELEQFDPIHYWIYSETLPGEDQLVQEIRQLILDLLAAKKAGWKKISYPYDFIGAAAVCEVFPQTVCTNWLTESYETIMKHIEDLLQKEYKKPEHEYCRRRL